MLVAPPIGTMKTPSSRRLRPRRAASVSRAAWSLMPSTSTTAQEPGSLASPRRRGDQRDAAAPSRLSHRRERLLIHVPQSGSCFVCSFGGYNTRNCRQRAAADHDGSSSPRRSRTMYSAYQSGQFGSAAPMRFSCSPWAADARRSAAARSLAEALGTSCQPASLRGHPRRARNSQPLLRSLNEAYEPELLCDGRRLDGRVDGGPNGPAERKAQRQPPSDVRDQELSRSASPPAAGSSSLARKRGSACRLRQVGLLLDRHCHLPGVGSVGDHRIRGEARRLPATAVARWPGAADRARLSIRGRGSPTAR